MFEDLHPGLRNPGPVSDRITGNMWRSRLDGDRGWMDSYMEKVKQQRDYCLERIQAIDGLEVESPGGAFYMFVRLTDPHWRENDKEFVLKLLEQEHVLLVHGSGFSPALGRGHVRLVYLPNLDVLEVAFDRIDAFLKRHRSSLQ